MVDWPGPSMSGLTQHSSSFTSSVSQYQFKVSSDTLFVVLTIATPNPCMETRLMSPHPRTTPEMLIQLPNQSLSPKSNHTCFSTPGNLLLPSEGLRSLWHCSRNELPRQWCTSPDFVYTVSFTRNLFLWVHISIYRCLCVYVCTDIHMKNTFLQLFCHSTKLTCFWYDSSSVQSLSHVQLFVIPWIAAHQASLFITNSRRSLRLMSIELVIPSSHLILCRPFLLLSPIPPASESFPMSQLFAWGGQSIGVSALASVLPKNTQDWSPLVWTSWISLHSKGLSRVFSNTTVEKHQFFGVQLSSQSNSHIHKWPLEKP